MVGTENPKPLPTLREDLNIEPAGNMEDGSKSWLIHDPLRHRFFRIGEQSVKLLKIWEPVLAHVLVDKALTKRLVVGSHEVEELAKFLSDNGLVENAGGWRFHAAQASHKKKGWFSTALHSYLFFRIPLFRPQKFLDTAWPFVKPLLSQGFGLLLFLLGIVSLILLSRQWEAFAATFISYLNWQGGLAFALTLVFVKAMHELGHAFMAKKYDVAVPVIGVAFLVLFPVLYTETSAAARLRDRRDRLIISFAGIWVELTLAVLASLAWVFLEDGPLRAAAFTTATVSWFLSLAINLNPFMRFDGYYILADLLRVENLQERGFAMARWRMREAFFRFGDAPPEAMPPTKRRALILHAWGTWIYRFFLFLGIAILVYHFFIKVVGILLFVVEIIWFILLPIWREMKIWWKRRGDMQSRGLVRSAAFVTVAVLVFLIPWQSHIHAPATLRAGKELRLFPSEPGKLISLNLTNGADVEANQALFTLAVPEINEERRVAEARLAVTETRLKRIAADQEDRSQRGVLLEQREAEMRRLSGLQKRMAKLQFTAPFSGRLTNLDPQLHEGQWLAVDLPMAVLKEPGGARFEALISEQDITRLKDGAQAKFIAEGIFEPAIPVVLVHMSSTSGTELEEPIHDAANGGDIATRPDPVTKAVHSLEPFYRVTLKPQPGTRMEAPDRIIRGVVVIEGEARSLASRLFKRVASILIRESGF